MEVPCSSPAFFVFLAIDVCAAFCAFLLGSGFCTVGRAFTTVLRLWIGVIWFLGPAQRLGKLSCGSLRQSSSHWALMCAEEEDVLAFIVALGGLVEGMMFSLGLILKAARSSVADINHGSAT